MVQFPPKYAIFGLNFIVGYLSDTIVGVGSDMNTYVFDYEMSDTNSSKIVGVGSEMRIVGNSFHH